MKEIWIQVSKTEEKRRRWAGEEGMTLWSEAATNCTFFLSVVWTFRSGFGGGDGLPRSSGWLWVPLACFGRASINFIILFISFIQLSTDSAR